MTLAATLDMFAPSPTPQIAPEIHPHNLRQNFSQDFQACIEHEEPYIPRPASKLFRHGKLSLSGTVRYWHKTISLCAPDFCRSSSRASRYACLSLGGRPR